MIFFPHKSLAGGLFCYDRKSYLSYDWRNLPWFFIDGIFVSVFAARGTDLLQSVRQVAAVPQLLSAVG